jgi:hypothetical protein
VDDSVLSQSQQLAIYLSKSRYSLITVSQKGNLMRLSKYLLWLTLPALSYAQITITVAQSVSKTLIPNTLQGYLSFEERSKNPNDIKLHINTLVAEVKKLDPNKEMCRGGGYQLSPYYNYTNQKQEFMGYSANLSFSCEFTTIEQYNTLVSALDKTTAQNVKKTQGALTWGVNAKTKENEELELRKTMISHSLKDATVFSKEIGKECSLNGLNFGGYSQQPMPVNMMRSSMAMDSAPTESPLQNDETITISATATYLCN